MSAAARAPLLLYVFVAACSGAAMNWPLYNNHYDGQRFAALDQINRANVAGLKRVCELAVGEEGTFETGPLLVGGMMYLTTPHNTMAVNATTCTVLWRRVAPAAGPAPHPNRGAAYLDGRLFRGMPDGSLAAFDARNGALLWQVPAGDAGKYEVITSAPIAWRGMVFAGLAIGDRQWLRGHVMAFDAATGKERWRFYTIPTGTEPGADTWDPPSSARTGGGGQWSTYTLDPVRGELFVPVGNPAPDFLPDLREGANLYTNSVVVLDAATGKLKWWFQATPHDAFDHDVGAAPVLYTTRGGVPMLAVAGKDGWINGIDRRTHARVFKTAATTVFNEGATVTADGVCVCPGALGGVEWNGPAYDPSSHALYAGAVDFCMVYDLSKSGLKKPCWGPKPSSEGSSTGWITAIDADSGALLWKLKTPAPVVAGVTPTAGGLIFTGDLEGTLYAIDEKSGTPLWTYATGAPIAGGVITYSIAGRQYIATTSGNVSRTFTGPSLSPRIVVLALEDPRKAR